MAQTGQSTENALYAGSPAVQPAANAFGGRLKRYRSRIAMTSQTVGEIALTRVPPGSVFAFGVITTSATLGSSTIAVGITGTVAKYKAAATFTAVNIPTIFGIAAAQDDEGLAAAEDIFATIASATLPASGTVIIDLYFSAL